jgi:hypothetical protein
MGNQLSLRTRRSRRGLGFALIPTGGVAADERFGWSDAAELTIEMATIRPAQRPARGALSLLLPADTAG